MRNAIAAIHGLREVDGSEPAKAQATEGDSNV